jgi:hypothetical protein
MGLFNKLMSKIFGGAPAGPSPGSATAGGQAATGTVSTSSSGTAPATSAVDVAAVLNSLAANNPEQLDWKRSIVDLMKLVGMDSSLAARKELATELGYTGDQSDSANMNIWLHKQVLKKLAENGGKVPQELLD